MSNASLQVAGILFIAIPTVAWGGYSIFRFLTKQSPGYLDNPVRRGLFTAGHAHAGCGSSWPWSACATSMTPICRTR